MDGYEEFRDMLADSDIEVFAKSSELGTVYTFFLGEDEIGQVGIPC